MKTGEMNEEMYKGTERCIFFSFLSWTHPNSHTVNVYCCSLVVPRDRVTVMLSALLHSTFTVPVLYKLYSLQLNCTYSNYTEAAPTCSAAQQERNCQNDVFWNEVQTLVWNYIVIQIQRLGPSDSRYWLQAQCRNWTAMRNKWMSQR